MYTVERKKRGHCVFFKWFAQKSMYFEEFCTMHSCINFPSMLISPSLHSHIADDFALFNNALQDVWSWNGLQVLFSRGSRYARLSPVEWLDSDALKSRWFRIASQNIRVKMCTFHQTKHRVLKSVDAKVILLGICATFFEIHCNFVTIYANLKLEVEFSSYSVVGLVYNTRVL